jgi:hypothetical protein
MRPIPAFTTGLWLGLVPVVALAPGGGAAIAQPSCAAQATRQTGFDPARPPPQAVANPQVAGSGARARGAAAGAIIGGASGGDAGKGAAAGAVGGAVVQRSRNRRATRAQNDANAQQQQSGQAAYNQALSNCLAGGGHAAQ